MNKNTKIGGNNTGSNTKNQEILRIFIVFKNTNIIVNHISNLPYFVINYLFFLYIK